MESVIRLSIMKYLAHSHAVTSGFGSTRGKCVQNQILCKPDKVEDNIL